jgi:transcriptional regulator with XRE-family HTH domain
MYGFTQKDLEAIFKAAGISMSQQAISNYENGEVKKEPYDVIQKLKDMKDGNIDDTMDRILVGTYLAYRQRNSLLQLLAG